MALSTIGTNQISNEVFQANRNLVKNGAMAVSQRATSSTGLGAANGYFTVDRMRMAIGDASAGRFTMAQTAVTDLSGFSKSVKISCTTADTSIAAGERLVLNYRFEGQDLQSLKSSSSSLKAFTVSFYARANAAFNLVSEIIFGADTSKNSEANQVNALTTSWQRFTMSIPAATNTQIDDVTTHDTDLMFWIHAGSTYTSGSNSTTLRPNVNANRAAGVSSIFASTSNFVEITGIQLEIGDTATPFEVEDFGTTLRKCQRYYVRMNADAAYSMWGAGFAYTSTATKINIPFPVEMRTAPSLGQSANNTLDIFTGGDSPAFTSDAVINNPSSWGTNLTCTVGSITVGYGCVIMANNSTAAYLEFLAEL